MDTLSIEWKITSSNLPEILSGFEEINLVKGDIIIEDEVNSIMADGVYLFDSLKAIASISIRALFENFEEVLFMPYDAPRLCVTSKDGNCRIENSHFSKRLFRVDPSAKEFAKVASSSLRTFLDTIERQAEFRSSLLAHHFRSVPIHLPKQ